MFSFIYTADRTLFYFQQSLRDSASIAWTYFDNAVTLCRYERVRFFTKIFCKRRRVRQLLRSNEECRSWDGLRNLTHERKRNAVWRRWPNQHTDD